MAISENKGSAAVVGSQAASGKRMSERYELQEEKALQDLDLRCRLSPPLLPRSPCSRTLCLAPP